MWIYFVSVLCELGKTNFINLLEKARPVPNEISEKFSYLKKYPMVM
jgi:hypothetical protein